MYRLFAQLKKKQTNQKSTCANVLVSKLLIGVLFYVKRETFDLFPLLFPIQSTLKNIEATSFHFTHLIHFILVIISLSMIQYTVQNIN